MYILQLEKISYLSYKEDLSNLKILMKVYNMYNTFYIGNFYKSVNESSQISIFFQNLSIFLISFEIVHPGNKFCQYSNHDMENFMKKIRLAYFTLNLISERMET